MTNPEILNNEVVRYQTVLILSDGREIFTDEEWKWKSEADRHGRDLWKANHDKIADWRISTYRTNNPIYRAEYE